MTPKHVVTVEHIWGIPRRYPQKGPSTHSVRICDRCGSSQRILRLHTLHDGRSIEELAESTDAEDMEDLVEFTKTMGEIVRQMADSIKSMERELFEGTGYRNLSDFAKQLQKRHQGAVKVDDLNFRIAQYIKDTNNGKTGSKHRRMVLLAFKQGLVCDICDKVVGSLDDLNEDHIIPLALGGESTLMNLRLTHWSCNDNKWDKPPTASDISPFAYQGEPCEHKVSCVKEESRSGSLVN